MYSVIIVIEGDGMRGCVGIYRGECVKLTGLLINYSYDIILHYLLSLCYSYLQ